MGTRMTKGCLDISTRNVPTVSHMAKVIPIIARGIGYGSGIIS